MTKVSVVVPCRNEEGYIGGMLVSLLGQETDGFELEILIADGMSDDGTRAVIEGVARDHPRVRLIDNPGRIVSTGLNAAIREAEGEIVVRMDAHTEYAPDYVRRCVEVLESSGADNVGGAWRARGRSYLQKAIAAGFQSPFSSGGARSHAVDYEGEVDSVYLGCWRRSLLLKIGLFDEALVRNQDDELNLRIILGGGRIWQSAKIRSWYCPRGSLTGLFRQYRQYGYWKVAVIRKHRRPASVRHLVPSAFVGGALLLAMAAPFSPVAGWGLAGLLGMYLVLNLVATVASLRRWPAVVYAPVLPFIFIAFHWGYGLGFLLGLVDFGLRRKAGRRALSELTR